MTTTTELAELARALRGSRTATFPTVVAAAAYAGPLMKSALDTYGAWETAAPGHRAAVLAAHLPERCEVGETAELADFTVKACHGQTPIPWNVAVDYARSHMTAAEVLGRLDRMPLGWREEAVRAALEAITAAVASTQLTRNFLQSRGFEVDVDAHS
ncbi:hypothetical protein [Streptomyces phytohabitans]|uniref:hypothetical protein n=1 Tax=Streptomyces phytohabitans TaxID=1150371 RepID=UPI00345B8D56